MDFYFFRDQNKSGYKTNEKWLLKNHPDVYNSIINYCGDIEFETNFKEKIWFFFNKTKERPRCLTCQNSIKFRNRLDKPYGDFCSLDCFNKNKNEMIDRQKKTFNKKYSIDFYPQHIDFIKKQKNTKKERYGDENYNNFEKSKITRKEKYGSENYNNQEKLKKTIFSLYGSDNISKTNWYKKQILKNIQDKYPNVNIKSADKTVLKIHCPKCNSDYEITKQLLYERYKRDYETCVLCNPIGQSSQSGYEKEMVEFLNSLDVQTVQSYRQMNSKYEVDVYLPEYNIGLEFNGVYWHNELFKDNNYHLNKHDICKENNIDLLQIFEDEWLYKKDIVKSIIKNRINKSENVLYARKCVIKTVDTQTSKKFLDDNHIQGNVYTKVKLGLYYNNELVSLMTFSKGRVIMGGDNNEWELTRFTNKINYSVVGGASKLFNFFIKNFKPLKVVSYSDIRLFGGNLYNKLGFKKISQSKPNYWYVINDKRYYRFNYRKGILIKQGYDKNKTEKEIMFDRGIYRIYDCGNIRWEYIL
jgi:hypothetical protein